MKVLVINGTPAKGVTYYMKELFIDHIGREHEIVEFYPKDFPGYCVGCKQCFVSGEEKCPHYGQINAIWQAVVWSDLIVFAYPVYALHAPASIKSVLDHFCVHWMVHRPEEKLFEKTAVIITNSVGAPNGLAQKDVKTSLTWMGVSNIYASGAGMRGDIFVDKMTQKHKEMLQKKMARAAQKAAKIKKRKHMNSKTAVIFARCKLQHKMVLKSEIDPSLDNAYFLEKVWMKRSRI